MMSRTIGVIGAIWIVCAPLTAFFVMWEFAFKTKLHYHLGNALIALVLFGPPLLMVALYLLEKRKRSHD